MFRFFLFSVNPLDSCPYFHLVSSFSEFVAEEFSEIVFHFSLSIANSLAIMLFLCY